MPVGRVKGGHNYKNSISFANFDLMPLCNDLKKSFYNLCGRKLSMAKA